MFKNKITKKKAVISLLLAFSLSANATNLNQYVTSYKSSAGSWSSPTTGMKYHYGGTYEFTFKGGNKYQPWITASHPELTIGCNGISLKGGFVGLLGLNELKDQIKDAGQSLAWGAFISLQYAVPGLFQVFTKIREWAAAIQSMLQNACNIGKSLASGSPLHNKLNNRTDGLLQGDGIDNTLSTWMEGGDTMLTKIQSLSGCAGLSGAVDPATGTSPFAKCQGEYGKSTASAITEKESIAKGSSSDLNKKIAPSSTPENKLYVGSLSTLLSSGKVQTKVAMSGSTVISEYASTMKLLRVFFGDLVMDTKSYKELVTKDTTGYDTPYTTGEYTIDYDQITEKLKSAKAGNSITDSEPTYILVKSVIKSAEAAAKALMYGITANTETTNCAEGYCFIDDATVFYSDFGSGDVRITKAGIVGDNKASTSSALKLEWSGAYNESMKSIRKKIKDLTGINPTWKTVYDGTGSIDSTSTSTTIPLLVPNIERHMQTIAKIEKVANGETGLSAHLKTVLAQQNSILLAKSLFAIIEGKMIDAEFASGSAQNVLDFADHIREVSRNVQNELEKIDVTSQNLKTINDLFLQIEEDLQNNKVRNF